MQIFDVVFMINCVFSCCHVMTLLDSSSSKNVLIFWKDRKLYVSLQQQFPPRLSTMRTTVGLRFL